MATTEQSILNHYNLKTLFPTEWPADKDSDPEEPAEEVPAKPKPSRRYTRLERKAGSRVSGAPKGPPKESLASSVQQDEPDPLGASKSVLAALKRRGLPVDEDQGLKNRFLLSSTTFSPSQYLSEVHRNASTDALLQGLDFLSHSIEKKSASLKVLVESNFERFVRAKATIDHVYEEMRNHGSEGITARRPHSRHVSRGSNSFRNFSGGPNSPTASRHGATEKSKNALAKESDYGTVGIKNPLFDATVKAEEIWGPALGGRQREENLKSLLSSMEKNRTLFETGLAVEECARRRDYDGLAEAYARMKKLAAEATLIANKAKENEARLADAQLHQIILAARIWQDVETRIAEFKRETMHRLTETQYAKFSQGADARSDEYMDLISVLLQLGVQENPITAYLFSHCEFLKGKANGLFERARIELEIMRRRLATSTKPNQKQLAKYLKTAAETEHREVMGDMDSFQVIQFWEKETAAIDSMLNMKTGILNEVIEYWDTAQGFVNGKKQHNLPIGIDAQSRHHHQLSSDAIQEIRARAKDLIMTIRDQLYALFIEKPVDDISSLYTPVPTTPKTPGSAMATTPTAARMFHFNPSDVPPPSPSTGEPWESHAFWPPHSNSLSAASFLSKLVNMIGTATAEMAGIELIRQDGRMIHQLRTLIGDIRERSVTAICAAWLSDCENCRELEDWSRSPEKHDMTRMPGFFSAYELSMLSSLQKIVYVSDAANASGSADVILPPPNRHIESVQSAFKGSFYKAFGGMMEHSSKPISGTGTGAGLTGEEVDLTIPYFTDGTNWSTDTGGALNKNVRKLLTMSNFHFLRTDIIPALIAQFEANFLKTITEDSKQAKEVLAQISARVFQAYVRPILDGLRALITEGVSKPDYATVGVQPSDAQPYVYSVLLQLALVHSEISLTAPSMTPQILSYLLEQISSHLITAFQTAREKYTLEALMQATLDVEFFAQTLSNYTTEKASETQGQIYLALDERTDNDARQRLQSELPEMRGILKRLREKTKGEFGAFKREKKRRGGEGSSGNHPSARQASGDSRSRTR